LLETGKLRLGLSGLDQQPLPRREAILPEQADGDFRFRKVAPELRPRDEESSRGDRRERLCQERDGVALELAEPAVMAPADRELAADDAAKPAAAGGGKDLAQPRRRLDVARARDAHQLVARPDRIADVLERAGAEREIEILVGVRPGAPD